MEVNFKASADAPNRAFVCWDDDVMAGDVKALDEQSSGALSRAVAATRFSGKSGQSLEVLAPSGIDVDRIILIGGGARDKADDRTWEKVGAGLVKGLLASGALEADIIGAESAESAARIGLGAILAAYRYDTYRTKLKETDKPSLASIGVVVSGKTGVKEANETFAPLAAMCEGVAFARDLVNAPPNVLYPETYALQIVGLAKHGLEIEILDEPAMESLGMRALLGVAQGSVHGPRVCILKWMGASDSKAPPLALIGKGVTFDSGGVSLKPGAGMDEMKGDMGGSAAVVGAMLSIAKRKAKANVIGLVGLVENMPDGKAQRPGDIVASASGQTIEILNTDAEGRLVLCDLMWLAQEKYKPGAIIDLATLTGAILVALGHEHAGLFSNNDELAEKISAAGKAEGETVWRLPMGAAYDKQIDSKIADMKNVGGRNAGSITAAQFLQRFVENDTPWAHLDIAGTAWKPGNGNPTEPSWATGFGVRLLDRLVADGYED